MQQLQQPKTSRRRRRRGHRCSRQQNYFPSGIPTVCACYDGAAVAVTPTPSPVVPMVVRSIAARKNNVSLWVEWVEPGKYWRQVIVQHDCNDDDHWRQHDADDSDDYEL